jgi:hypothetical protein
MSEINIVDTTYRDANASQWGEKMSTAMMYTIAPMMNRAGFKALDATAVSQFGKQIKPVDQNLMDRIQGLSRTKEFMNWERPLTSIEDIRREMGADWTDDELLLLVLVPEDDFKAMKAAGPIKTEYSGAGKPLSAFIKELAKQKKSAFISIQREDFALTLNKCGDGEGQ